MVVDCDGGRSKVICYGAGSDNGGSKCDEGCVVVVLVMVVVIGAMEVSGWKETPETYRYDVSLQGNHVEETE